MDAQTQKDNAISVLLGGEKLTVKLLTGETEEVLVRRLPISAYPQMTVLRDDEPRLVELLCDKPPGWADTITPESHNEIAEQGEAINFPSYARWLKRRTRFAADMEPVMGMAARQASHSTSPSSSPSSAARAG